MAFIDRYNTPAIGGYRDEYATSAIDRYRDEYDTPAIDRYPSAINRYEAPTFDTGFVSTTSTADPYLNAVLNYLDENTKKIKHQDSFLPPPPEYSAKNRPSEPVYKREEKEYQDDDPEAFDEVDVPEPDIYGFYDVVGAMNPPSKAEQYSKTAVFGLMNLMSPIPFMGKALSVIDILSIQNQQNKIAQMIGREPVTIQEAFNFSRGQEIFTEVQISEFAQFSGIDENTVGQPGIDGFGTDRGGWGTPTGLNYHAEQKSIPEIQAMIDWARWDQEEADEDAAEASGPDSEGHGPDDDIEPGTFGAFLGEGQTITEAIDAAEATTPFGQTTVSQAPAYGAEGELGDSPSDGADQGGHDVSDLALARLVRVKMLVLIKDHLHHPMMMIQETAMIPAMTAAIMVMIPVVLMDRVNPW